MDNSTSIIDQTIAFVKESLHNAEGGHDWFHIQRVWQTAKTIAQEEGANLLVVELAALLHDIADAKFHGGDDDLGAIIAEEFLQKSSVDDPIIAKVCAIIKNTSFKGGNAIQDHHSLELDVVRDADRLDALGAIGIARAFNYGGFKNRKMYDPDITPKLDMSREEYRTSTAPTINHFYEKLFLLKDIMATRTGKRMAAERHHFMEDFVNRFYKEWEGVL